MLINDPPLIKERTLVDEVNTQMLPVVYFDQLPERGFEPRSAGYKAIALSFELSSIEGDIDIINTVIIMIMIPVR